MIYGPVPDDWSMLSGVTVDCLYRAKVQQLNDSGDIQ